MNDNGNKYGFTSNVDTHMMKNGEWGVVAYLSQSKYGKLGNINFTGSNKEIYQNKSNQYITGCSYGSPSNANAGYGCQYQYNVDINGTGASTTGNVSGVYDMSGGAWEYVMGNYNDTIGNSGFSTMPESKYYDKYITFDANTACNNSECISHSLSETSAWYNDYHRIVDEMYPWFLRSGGYNDNIGAGVFGSHAWSNGSVGSDRTFRLVATMGGNG